MCVIIAKLKNIEPPKIETLKEAWDTNPDGAGIAFTVNKKIVVKRGFMTWDSFKDYYDNLKSKIALKPLDVVFHFRVSTGGGVVPQNTHPFTAHGDNNLLEYSTEQPVLFHNGYIKHIDGNATKSDTRIFTEKFLKLPTKELFSQPVQTILNKIADTKLLYLTSNGIILSDSKDFEIEDGIIYSNRYFEYNKYYNKYNYTKNYDKSIYNSYYDELLPLSVVSQEKFMLFMYNSKNKMYKMCSAKDIKKYYVDSYDYLYSKDSEGFFTPATYDKLEVIKISGEVQLDASELFRIYKNNIKKKCEVLF